jgi:hypothetical protein
MHCLVPFKKSWLALTAALLVSTAAITLVAPAAATRSDASREAWEHDWVALTVARNGTWGAATNANLTRAMMQAIRDCMRKSASAGNDCGAEITTVRASWSIAYACGEYTFIANGDTPADARIAAIHRAIDMQDILGFELAPCGLVVAVGTDGSIEPSGGQREYLSLPK